MTRYRDSGTYQSLRAFVAESNRIEGIQRPPTADEMYATEQFVFTDHVDTDLIVALVVTYQPGARLRDRPGLDVYVGTHHPPPGGPGIPTALAEVLQSAISGQHPYLVHHAYETLHPFTDGNGRSGRALWLWGMRQRGGREWRQALALGFLHCWYYESLEFWRPNPQLKQLSAEDQARVAAWITGHIDE